MSQSVFRTKSLTELISKAQGDHGLKRTLTATNLIALGIGAIIGAGIFVLTGKAAAEFAGPALALSFVLSGFGCAMAGLCYAEFAAMIPVAGSAYTYAYATLGEIVAWFIGWVLILEYLFGASTVAVAWSEYVISFLEKFSIHLPTSITQSPIIYTDTNGFQFTGSLINFPALVIVALVTTVLVVGIQESARFNNIIVFVKLAVVLLFIGFGMSYIDTANWTPFIPEPEIAPNGSSRYGWWGIVQGAAYIFFAYIGFDAVSTTAQEAKNPQRDMPIGILVSLAVCTLLYIALSLVMTGIVPYKELDAPAPIAKAIERAQELEWLSPWISIGAIAGLSSVVLVMLMGQPRVFFSMAHDGLLPKTFARVHPKYGTPHVTTILTGSVAAVMASLFPTDFLAKLVNMGTLMAFSVVCIAVIVLRYAKPDLHRPFKTPLVPLVPGLGALICLAQMVSLPLLTWLLVGSWLLIGLVIYLNYGRKHSTLNREN